MRIVLNAGSATWLGGRYYLENLARAIRTLDESERPDLLVDTDSFPEGLARAVDGIPADADLVFPNWGLGDTGRVVQIHWIPDLQHRALPANFSRLERLRRDVGYRRLARRARLVVVSSDVVHRAAAAAYPGARAKLRTVHFRTALPGDLRRRDVRDTLERYGLPARYVLLPNQFWAHKNHATAFAALDRLPLPVVCTGEPFDHRRPGFAESLIASARSDRLHVLGVVPRDDYLQLVRGAAAILQPSLFEGWSSIVEDARALGKPIALSSIDVHREQDPPRGFFFEPTDSGALLDAAVQAIEAGSEAEDTAIENQRSLVAAYARRFVEVAAEALGTIGP
jgi:hypothetical protein